MWKLLGLMRPLNRYHTFPSLIFTSLVATPFAILVSAYVDFCRIPTCLGANLTTPGFLM